MVSKLICRRSIINATIATVLGAAIYGGAVYLGNASFGNYAKPDVARAMSVEAKPNNLTSSAKSVEKDVTAAEVAMLQLEVRIQKNRAEVAEERAEKAEERLKDAERLIIELEAAPTYPADKRFYPIKKNDPGYNAKTGRYMVSRVEPAYMKRNADYYFETSDTHFAFVEREGSSVVLLADGTMYRFELGGTYGILGGKTNRCQFSMTDAGKRGVKIEEACFS